MSAGTRLRIRGGAVHDPANGVDGEVRDVCIEDGRIVASLPDDAPVLDARGTIVMAGGVDIHSHIASSSCNHARRLLPEERVPEPAPAGVPGARSGTFGTVPSTFTTGYRYAGLGYTTVFDAAVAPVMARHTHHEMDDTPCIDAGFFALMGNDRHLLDLIDRGERDRARDYMAWLLGSVGGYAVKIVNPGGVEAWKTPQRNLTDLDTPLGSTRVTARGILEALTDAANALRLPHPVHIHANNLGLPGNVATTLESMRALEGRRCHFTHVQFHAYGTGGGWKSAARELIGYVNAHPSLSVDVGQVMFGPACTITADGPAEYLLYKSSGGRKYVNIDVELETGCGIMPMYYKDKAAVATLQWAIGLELFLLAEDPWRVVLSTDHPNGASFMAYPNLIELLMSRAVRDEALKQANPKLLAGSALLEGLDREYTLNEIAIITRAGPARLLGLRHKGHLGVGADADVTIYDRNAHIAAMFMSPRWVLKRGEVVVEEGQLRRAPHGRRLWRPPGYDDAVLPGLRRHFEAHGTVRMEHYAIRDLPGAPVEVG
jgi:formylmethanofuran dehydrogenase subunit A